MSLLKFFLASMLASTSPSPAAPDDDGAAHRLALENLGSSLRVSASPRDRALSTLLTPWQEPSRAVADGRVLREAASAAPADALVQGLWATASRNADGCSAASPCPERRLALARLEPDNGLAWLSSANYLDASRDAAEIEALLAKMANAERFDDHYVELVGALAPLLERMGPREQASIAAVAFAAARSMSWNWVALTRACKRENFPALPPRRFEDCAKVGRAIFYSDSSLSTRNLGFATLRASGLATEQDFEDKRRMDWRMYALIGHSGAPSEDLRFIADMLSTRSETRALELMRARQGMPQEPPADWTVEAAVRAAAAR